jgi:hypothetical protein
MLQPQFVERRRLERLCNANKIQAAYVLGTNDIGSDEYDQAMRALERINDMEASTGRKKLDPTQAFVSVVGLVGIGVVATTETTRVWATKAIDTAAKAIGKR